MSERDDDLPFVPADQASRAQRWALPSLLDDWEQPSTAVPRAPTAAELDAIQQAAWNEGYERGLLEGRNTGFEKGLSDARAEAERLVGALEHLAAPLAELDGEVERALGRLALQLAERLVAQQLTLAPETVQSVVREALDAATATATGLKVHLHPADAELLDQLMPNVSGRSWTLEPDPAITRGGCEVVTEFGRVDARIETRRAELAMLLDGDAP